MGFFDDLLKGRRPVSGFLQDQIQDFLSPSGRSGDGGGGRAEADIISQLQQQQREALMASADQAGNNIVPRGQESELGGDPGNNLLQQAKEQFFNQNPGNNIVGKAVEDQQQFAETGESVEDAKGKSRLSGLNHFLRMISPGLVAFASRNPAETAAQFIQQRVAVRAQEERDAAAREQRKTERAEDKIERRDEFARGRAAAREDFEAQEAAQFRRDDRTQTFQAEQNRLAREQQESLAELEIASADSRLEQQHNNNLARDEKALENAQTMESYKAVIDDIQSDKRHKQEITLLDRRLASEAKANGLNYTRGALLKVLEEANEPIVTPGGQVIRKSPVEKALFINERIRDLRGVLNLPEEDIVSGANLAGGREFANTLMLARDALGANSQGALAVEQMAEIFQTGDAEAIQGFLSAIQEDDSLEPDARAFLFDISRQLGATLPKGFIFLRPGQTGGRPPKDGSFLDLFSKKDPTKDPNVLKYVN